MQEQSTVSVSFTEGESDFHDLPHPVLFIRVSILIVLTYPECFAMGCDFDIYGVSFSDDLKTRLHPPMLHVLVI